MKDKGIITKEKRLARNKQNYMLSPARIFERRWFGSPVIESESERDKKMTERPVF